MSEPGHEPDNLEAHIPPLVGRVQASLRGEQFVFTFPDGQELAYNREEADFIYTTLYQHRRHLTGARASIIPTPDGQYFALSGEAAVQLLAHPRELRKQLGLPEPKDASRYRWSARTARLLAESSA